MCEIEILKENIKCNDAYKFGYTIYDKNAIETDKGDFVIFDENEMKKIIKNNLSNIINNNQIVVQNSLNELSKFINEINSIIDIDLEYYNDFLFTIFIKDNNNFIDDLINNFIDLNEDFIIDEIKYFKTVIKNNKKYYIFKLIDY